MIFLRFTAVVVNDFQDSLFLHPLSATRTHFICTSTRQESPELRLRGMLSGEYIRRRLAQNSAEQDLKLFPRVSVKHHEIEKNINKHILLHTKKKHYRSLHNSLFCVVLVLYHYFPYTDMTGFFFRKVLTSFAS